MTSFTSIADLIGRALLHSVWEGAALALLFATAMVFLRNRSAQSRYIAGCVALALMVAAPIATVAVRLNAAPAQSAAVFSAATRVFPVTKSQALEAPLGSQAPAVEHTTLSILQGTTLVWSIGLFVVSLWQIRGWFVVRNLVRRSLPAAVDRVEQLQRLCDRVRIRFPVAMRICDQLTTPALVGWLRPVILIPPAALCDLRVDYFESLLLHELAHVRRHDYLINLLQTVIDTLLFYHPAAWWVSRVIRQEREFCCDDETIRQTDSKVYVRALAAMESARSEPVAHLAMTASGGNLLRRIQRLTGTAPRGNRSNAGFLSLSALLIAIVVFSASYAAESRSSDKPPLAMQPPTPVMGHARAIVPDDLVEPKFTTYRIQPGDRLLVTVWDLTGPNSSAVRSSTVDERGMAGLLVLKDPISVAGLTEMEAETAVKKAYREAQMISQPVLSVNVTEPHAQSFAIVGAVSHAGQFSIPDPRFHLLNAIALAGGTVGEIRRIIVQRSSPDGAIAAIEVPAFQLLSGDPSFNIVIRPRDTVVVSNADGAMPGAALNTAPATQLRR